jgi:hypothetical protein
VSAQDLEGLNTLRVLDVECKECVCKIFEGVVEIKLKRDRTFVRSLEKSPKNWCRGKPREEAASAVLKSKSRQVHLVISKKFPRRRSQRPGFAG